MCCTAPVRHQGRGAGQTTVFQERDRPLMADSVESGRDIEWPLTRGILLKNSKI